MNQLSNANSSERLRDKFSKVEILIDDERFIHKLNKDSIEKIKVNGKIKRPMVSLSLMKIIKMMTLKLVDYFKMKCFYLMSHFFSYGRKHFYQVVEFARNKEEQAELFLEHKVNKIEMMRKEIKEYEDLNKLNKEMLIEDYRKNISQLFLNQIDSRAFPINITDSVSLQGVLIFQMKLMNVISTKLLKSNMIINVKKINMSLNSEGDSMISRINFELDKKGHLWCVMFGKSVVPDINNFLLNRQGKVMIKQVCNTAINKDLFSVTIHYKIKEKNEVPALVTISEKVGMTL